MSPSATATRQLPVLAPRTAALTLRPTCEALERQLTLAHPVLDHGFVRLVDYMGDQDAVCDAARVSYGRGTRSRSDNRGLLRYLIAHWHTTPLEMTALKLHAKMPIFVARQWVRHRMASINEVSARYSILDKEFYLPEPEQMKAQSVSNRQGRGDLLTPEEQSFVRRLLLEHCTRGHDEYELILNERADGSKVNPEHDGLARELARIGLPLGTYTQWYWKTDLKNLLDFLRLRTDPHAQWEVRAYADVIAGWVAEWVPDIWQAFIDYRRDAVSLPAPLVAQLKKVAGNNAKFDCMLRGAIRDAGLSEREQKQLLANFS